VPPTPVSGAGVYGNGATGVQGIGDQVGIRGSSPNGTGVYGAGGAHAGYFEGQVHVNGKADITDTLGVNGQATFATDVNVNGTLNVKVDVVLTNADCAEEFDAVGVEAEPGTVMVLDEQGRVEPSSSPYDRKVAGIVSGAGEYRPALVLDRRESSAGRKPLALMGKVYCKVDASFAPIAVGDLLTTSSTPGHAMKAVDPASSFGAVIGKALRPLARGQSLIPVLVALQ
jgi:hypothetical protein